MERIVVMITLRPIPRKKASFNVWNCVMGEKSITARGEGETIEKTQTTIHSGERNRGTTYYWNTRGLTIKMNSFSCTEIT